MMEASSSGKISSELMVHFLRNTGSIKNEREASPQRNNQCKKKRYAQVLNVNELNYMMEKPMLQSGLRWLLIMVIGGAIILAVAAIPIHFSNQAREQRVEELKEKQQEIIKERYGF